MVQILYKSGTYGYGTVQNTYHAVQILHTYIRYITALGGSDYLHRGGLTTEFGQQYFKAAHANIIYD